MKSFRLPLVSLLISSILAMPAEATYNATAVGTVTYLTQMGPSVGFAADTVVFTLANQPSNPCQANGYQQFVISPSTVTDAEMRRNMLAILLTAKSSGAQVQVAYDNQGGYCDQNAPAVYYLTLL